MHEVGKSHNIWRDCFLYLRGAHHNFAILFFEMFPIEQKLRAKLPALGNQVGLILGIKG